MAIEKGAQFEDVSKIAGMVSSDYGVPMSQVAPLMQARWDERDSHPDLIGKGDRRHGGPRGHIEHLKADIAKRGMRKPVDLSERRGMVVNGNHRVVAAMELGLDKIPVRRLP